MFRVYERTRGGALLCQYDIGNLSEFDGFINSDPLVSCIVIKKVLFGHPKKCEKIVKILNREELK